MTGRVVHFEVPYDDAGRAERFYTQAFGWPANTVMGPDYTLVSTGPTHEDGQPAEPGFINGGLRPRAGSFAPAPLLVVEVDDIEGALTRIEEAGGATVEGRLPVGDLGFSAYARDTEGNIVGLWQNAEG